MMNPSRHLLLSMLSVCALISPAAQADDGPVLVLQSPNKQVEIRLGANAEGQPTYAVSLAGQSVIAPSPLGLQLDKAQGGALAAGLTRTGSSPGSADNPY